MSLVDRIDRRASLRIAGGSLLAMVAENALDHPLARAAEALISPEKEFPCRIDVDFRVARGSESFRPTTAGLRYVVWGYGSDPDRDGVVYEIAQDSPLQTDGSKPKDRNTKIVGPNQLVKAEPNGHQPCPDGSNKECIATTQVYASELDENGARYPAPPVASKPFPVDCTQPKCDVLFWIINREKAPAATVTPTEVPATSTPTQTPTAVSTQPGKLPRTGGGP